MGNSDAPSARRKNYTNTIKNQNEKVNYAAIDIGSNAVRLLIKSVNEEGSPEGLLRKVQLIRIPLRLGEDAFTTGEISEGKAEN